jgi:hypothetical protein
MSGRTASELAGLADCASPDGPDSDGAAFLYRVADAVADAIAERDSSDDPSDDWSDMAHEIADGAVPIQTWTLWRTFVDLCAWQAFDDYRDEMGGDSNVSNDHGDGMTAQAAVALYWIADRLAVVLLEADGGEADDDDDDESGEA